MCSAAHSEWVGQLVGRTSRSAPSRRQHPAGLGERPVVADVHPDPQPARVVDRERPVAGVGEACRRRGTAGGPCGTIATRPAGPDQDAGVEEAVAVALRGSRRSRRRRAAGTPRPPARDARPVDRLGVGEGLVPALEAVAGQGALGEDDELCARRRPPRRAARGSSSRLRATSPSFGSICTAATRTVWRVAHRERRLHFGLGVERQDRPADLPVRVIGGVRGGQAGRVDGNDRPGDRRVGRLVGDGRLHRRSTRAASGRRPRLVSWPRLNGGWPSV